MEQIRSMMQSMEMYKEMSKTMEMMKDFMPDMASFTGNPEQTKENGFDMMGMLMNMLTPEQKQMFEMFGGNMNAE